MARTVSKCRDSFNKNIFGIVWIATLGSRDWKSSLRCASMNVTIFKRVEIHIGNKVKQYACARGPLL